MGLNKVKGQAEGLQRVLFRIVDTAGTPSIADVSPSLASVDMSITDTGVGIYDVVIKNFKGPQGKANVQATSETTSTMAACTARSYSGDDLSLTIKVEDDVSTLTDSSVCVIAEAI